MTRCYMLPDLYAGKMHALLFRNWKTRIKGRDWYDFEWYLRNNVRLDFSNFCERSGQFGSLQKDEPTKNSLQQLLKEKIGTISIDVMKRDVKPFIRNQEEMDIWSIDYFIQLDDWLI